MSIIVKNRQKCKIYQFFFIDLHDLQLLTAAILDRVRTIRINIRMESSKNGLLIYPRFWFTLAKQFQKGIFFSRYLQFKRNLHEKTNELFVQ